MELETVKVSRFKSKKFWFKVIGVFVGLMIFYGIGNSSAKTDLNGEKVTYDGLVKKVDSKNKEIKTVESKLADVNQQLNEKGTELDAATQVINNKKDAEDQLTTLTNQENDKKNQIADLDKQIKAKNDDLDKQIKAKQDELAAVTGQIKAKNEAPKTLPAGNFTVGKDIPSGRYKVVSNGGSGNFFINGGAKANIMLGNGELFVSEYVFEVSDGDTIETNLPTKYIAVQ